MNLAYFEATEIILNYPQNQFYMLLYYIDAMNDKL